MYIIGAKEIVEKLLPVVDSFERGLATATEEQLEDPFVDGMNKVYKQMITSLEELGVKPKRTGICANVIIDGNIMKENLKNSNKKESWLLNELKSKKIDLVRNKVRKLTKEYEFDFVSDSKRYSKEDYGFKIKYQGTTVGFFPYSLIDNDLTIKTYSLNKEKDKIDFKKKIIPRVTKSSVIEKSSNTVTNEIKIE